VATLKESILALVRSAPGLTDREITNRLLGSRAPLQAVNKMARSLVAEGLVARRCRYDGKLGNYAAAVSQGPSLGPVAGGESIEAIDPLSEDEVKRKVQAWLEGVGWNVVVTWGRSQGVNIDARQSGRRWVIEAKGRGSLDPMQVNDFLGVLGELLQQMRDPQAKYSVALPDLWQFRRLWDSLPEMAKRRTGFSALFVDDSGSVEELASKRPIVDDLQQPKSVAVWLEDSRARLMVGAPAQVAKRGRWAVDGTIIEDAGAGLWLKADTVQEFRSIAKGVKQFNWVFKSSQLFIPWGAILTIQVFEGGTKEIGFNPTPVE
jgi:hypothetical protein